MNHIDWQSSESHVLLNPKLPQTEKNRLLEMLSHFQLDGHIFLATSGSTAVSSTDIKWVALKKEAILISSAAVNKHLHCTKNDVLLNALPHFHIGGLSLFSRAHLSGAKVVDIYSENYKWDPHYFVTCLEDHKVTITSLVPTQVYDLMYAKLRAPKHLKCVVVGGGAFSKNLYEEGLKLGWKCLPSYGMTECCSQVATATFDFAWEDELPQLTVLSHLNVTTDIDKRLCISGQSLLTGYILQKADSIEFQDPKVNNKMVTSDLGKIEGQKLMIYGRENDVIKINGENVSLSRLDSILLDIKNKFHFCDDAAIFSVPDERSGNKIRAAFLNQMHTEMQRIEQIVSEFNKTALPFEKIRHISFVEKIPRSDLGKLKRNLLSEMCT